MEILVSGSLAYDRIMDFPGRFSDHIMPDKVHMINVSFTVNGLKENFGGTAGNIAYSLSLLEKSPASSPPLAMTTTAISSGSRSAACPPPTSV